MILVYTDDLVKLCAAIEKIPCVKSRFQSVFELNDLGQLRDYLGVTFAIKGNKMLLLQEL